MQTAYIIIYFNSSQIIIQNNKNILIMQAHPSLVSTSLSQAYAFGGVSARSVSLHLQADRRLFRGPHAELTVRCLAVVPSQPARQASVTVSLRPSHQQLRNQKLEWPNSAGTLLYICAHVFISAKPDRNSSACIFMGIY